jgi:hypothetical protein
MELWTAYGVTAVADMGSTSRRSRPGRIVFSFGGMIESMSLIWGGSVLGNSDEHLRDIVRLEQQKDAVCVKSHFALRWPQYRAGRHQTHGVTQLGDFTCPMMGGSAGFHADKASRNLAKEVDDLLASKVRLEPTVMIDAHDFTNLTDREAATDWAARPAPYMGTVIDQLEQMQCVLFWPWAC